MDAQHSHELAASEKRVDQFSHHVNQLQHALMQQQKENSKLMVRCKELEMAQQLKPPQAGMAGNSRLGQITAELQHQLGERKHADNGTLEQAEVQQLASLLESASQELHRKAAELSRFQATADDTQKRLRGRIETLEHEREQLSKANRQLEVENWVALEELSGSLSTTATTSHHNNFGLANLSKPREGSPAQAHRDQATSSVPGKFRRVAARGADGPNNADSIGAKVEALQQKFRIQGVELPVTHVKGDMYRIGKKRKAAMGIRKGKLVVRVGRGFCDLIEYLERLPVGEQ